MRGVEVGEVAEKAGQDTLLPETMKHTLGNLVGSIGIEVCVVGKRFVLTGICVCRIVHETLLGSLLTPGLEECAGVGMKVDEGDFFAACQHLHSLGIVGVRLLYPAVPEGAALGGGDEYGRGTFEAHLVNHGLEGVGEIVVCSGTREALLLVVVAELHHHVVAGLEILEDALETEGGAEGGGRLAALGIVGNGNLFVEEAGQHLSPRSPGFLILIHNGGIAAEIDGGTDGVGSDAYVDDGRTVAGDFNGEHIVPVEFALFALLYLHALGGGDDGGVLVDEKGKSGDLTLACGNVLAEETAALTTYCGGGCTLLAADGDGEEIIAVGKGIGEHTFAHHGKVSGAAYERQQEKKNGVQMSHNGANIRKNKKSKVCG